MCADSHHDKIMILLDESAREDHRNETKEVLLHHYEFISNIKIVISKGRHLDNARVASKYA